MADTIRMFLDLSHDTEKYLQQQGIDLYREIQQEMPDDVTLKVMSDPNASTGSKDLATVIIASAALVTSLTPIITRILNQFRPDTTEWVVEEEEMHNPDKTVITYRKHIYSKREYNQMMLLKQRSTTLGQIAEPKPPLLKNINQIKDTTEK